MPENKSPTSRSVASRLSREFRLTDGIIALVLFYLPWAHFPAPRLFRTVLLRVPTWGAGTERDWTITPFLVPETVVVLLLLLGIMEARRRASVTAVPGLGPLLWTAGLTLVGGALSLGASQYVGISISGLAGRLTVFALALAIALSRPTVATVRLWTYAAIGGTALMCAVGLFYFYQAFGIPTSLSSLPIFRVSAGIAQYQHATYGIGGNTVDLLVLTTPTAIALLIAGGPSIVARVFLGVSALLMYANLLVSFERWAWVCMGLSVVVILYYFRRQRRSYVVLAALSLAVVVLGSAVVTELGDYFQSATQPGSGSNYILRMHAWGEGVSVFLDNPAGVGLGTAGTLPALSEGSSHNLFIDIGIEGGVISLAGALVWAIYHLAGFVRVMLRRDPEDDVRFALLLGTLVFVLYGVFFNSLLYFSGLMVWFALWICFPVMAFALSRSPAVEPQRAAAGASVIPARGPAMPSPH